MQYRIYLIVFFLNTFICMSQETGYWTILNRIDGSTYDICSWKDTLFFQSGMHSNYFSSDAGQSWFEIPKEFKSGSIISPQFLSPDTLLAQMRVFDYISTVEHKLVMSYDTGKTWNIVSELLPLPWNLSVIGKTIYYSGKDTNDVVHLMKSIDYGRTWGELQKPTGYQWNSIMINGYPWIALFGTFFENEDEGYIYTDSGRVFRTITGGSDWVECSLPQKDVSIMQMYRFDNTLFAITDSIEVYKSYNDGLNWFKSNNKNNSFSKPQKILFIDSLNGIAEVNDYDQNFAYLIQTSNGGLTWNEIVNHVNTRYTSLFYLKDKRIFLFGDEHDSFNRIQPFSIVWKPE